MLDFWQRLARSGEATVSIGSRCRSLVPQPPTVPPWINWRQPPLPRRRQYQVARNFRPGCPSPPLWCFSVVRYWGWGGLADAGATPRKKYRPFFRAGAVPKGAASLGVLVVTR